MFSKKATKFEKIFTVDLTLATYILHNVKSTVKISSIFVAFLEWHICYFGQLLFDTFFCSAVEETCPKWQIFISHFVFRRKPAEFCFSKNFVKWMQVKFTKMTLQRHHVLCRFKSKAFWCKGFYFCSYQNLIGPNFHLPLSPTVLQIVNNLHR